jgi:hypothetical protein
LAQDPANRSKEAKDIFRQIDSVRANPLLLACGDDPKIRPQRRPDHDHCVNSLRAEL